MKSLKQTSQHEIHARSVPNLARAKLIFCNYLFQLMKFFLDKPEFPHVNFLSNYFRLMCKEFRQFDPGRLLAGMRPDPLCRLAQL
jgi:hypothetical protein